jgi:hypothetical protein
MDFIYYDKDVHIISIAAIVGPLFYLVGPSSHYPECQPIEYEVFHDSALTQKVDSLITSHDLNDLTKAYLTISSLPLEQSVYIRQQSHYGKQS